jgi:hypothetical protein
MAFPTPVNSQITDSVARTNTKGLGPAPAIDQVNGASMEGVRSIYDMATVPTRLSGLSDLLKSRKGDQE